MTIGILRKVLHLVPDAKFKHSRDVETRIVDVGLNDDGVMVRERIYIQLPETIDEWLDPRPEPTQAEIDVVTDQDVIDSELDIESGRVIEIDKFRRLLFELNFDQENRTRVLEGIAVITKAQYKTAIKNLYKTL